ncbi:protocadherin-like wing polarity protein stan [Neocloeon triangulifer]|uniref:protocadherin-like wing polarity protein stan n=1 Tax=Neocloeon triangulifer TaxID=2078957 RepID=UPI00286F47A3|nr:protocadherin-like wing polarity protein stan [Neocloeon triangulifer]
MQSISLLWYLLLHVLVHLADSQGLDNRCYLQTGGSAESFFVAEDAPVGSVIGSVRVHGDPGERGDISLRLRETDSPVQIAPGTGNLTLTRKLDKEGIDGPSSVYVNVICDRQRAPGDPSFVIPVNIRVTDANDNAPQFLNAPYVLNISEVTVVGTRVLQGIRAIDVDQQGPYSTVQYSVLPGPHSDYFVFINGLEGTLVLRKALDYETLTNFTVTLRAQDQGNPPQVTDTILYVNVVDADDQNPRFFDDRYMAIVPDRPLQGTELKIHPRDIMAFDQDVGINATILYTFNGVTGDYRFFEVDQTTGKVTLRRHINDDDILQPATLVVRASQHDNPDRYSLATLTVARVGTRGAEMLTFLQKDYTASVLESLPVGSVILTLLTSRPGDKKVRMWVEERGEKVGNFAVTPSGDVTLLKALDYELRQKYTFLVHATDGIMNSTARVEIKVLNVNDWDPRFRYPQYDFRISGRHLPLSGAIVGTLEVADGDFGDKISLELRGPSSRAFTINDKGEIRVSRPELLNSSTAHLVAIAMDSGQPPRQASVPITVSFPEAVGLRGSIEEPNSRPALLATVLGSLLGLLGLIVALLLIYIYKHKNSKRNRMVDDNSRDKLPSKMDNPLFGGAQFLTAGNRISANDIPTLYTATVKRSLNGVSMGGMLSNMSRQVAPAAPPKVSWPKGSIPRRVKKLSWDDENNSSSTVSPTPNGRRTELDPDVSVTPLTNHNEPSLTVYF